MNGEQFLEAARWLLTGTSESDWRSAMSRNYYAVFHFGRELCLVHGLDLGPSGQAHSNLYIGLNNCGHPIVQGLAGKLDILRTDRVRADYDLAWSVRKSYATVIVDEAETLLATFAQLLQTTSAAQIISGAKRHLRSIGRIP